MRSLLGSVEYLAVLESIIKTPDILPSVVFLLPLQLAQLNNREVNHLVELNCSIHLALLLFGALTLKAQYAA